MRKVIAIVVLLLVAALMVFLVRECKRRMDSKKMREVSSPLPDFRFIAPDGKPVTPASLKAEVPLAVFYMHPDCDHCQEEAAQLQKNISLFDSAQILIVSGVSVTRLDSFVSRYELKGRQNVIIAADTDYKFESWFGDAPYPTVIVYNAAHKVTANYTGGAKMELIRKMMKGEAKHE